MSLLYLKHHHLHLKIFCLVFTFLFVFHTTIRADISDTGIAPNETAQTNPKLRNVSLTGSVGDHIPPTAPILISPADNSFVTTTTPTFIWKPSTDDVAIAKYQLFLDGNLLFDNIPTGSTTTADYTLVVEDGEMKLTPFAPLSQGIHTWFVVAFDTSGNSTPSAIFTFTISTIGPLTIITSIGGQTTNIRSDTPSTVPTSPIILDQNQPLIVGTSQVGATLQLTVVIPNEPNQVFTQTLSTQNFSFQLGVLPTNVVIYLSLVSTDQLGNNSTINNIPILIKPAVIVTPIQVIPVPRVSEIITSIRKLLSSLPVIGPIIKALTPLIISTAPVLVATAAIAQSGVSLLSPLLAFLSRLLQAIGIIPAKRPRGLVYDTKTGLPIAFATVFIISESGSKSVDSVVTDIYGIYQSIQLPPGKYRIEASHADYVFPTSLQPNFATSIYDFYRGETFTITKNNQELTFLIPLDPKEDKTHPASRQIYFYTALFVFRRLINNLFYPMLAFSLLVTLFFPTILNMLILSIYFVILIFKFIESRRAPVIKITVVDKNNHPMVGVFIRCFESKTNRLRAILSTDKSGQGELHLHKDDYTLLATRDGYVIKQESQDYNSVYLHHFISSKVRIVMVPIEDVIQKNEV